MKPQSRNDIHLIIALQFAIISMLVAFVLTSCGTQPTSPQTQEEWPAGIDYQDDEKEVVVEYRKNGTSYSIAVEDTADLPECTRGNSKQLAYVKNQDLFFSCEEESWLEVDIRGEQGPIGPEGPKGQTTSANEWRDPITGRWWLFGAVTATRILAASACTNGYYLPTSTEAINAVSHGLLTASAAIPGPASIWVSDPPEKPSPYDASFYVNASGVRKEQDTSSIGIACVK